ncbi:helix-turn-helix domain-containing protein [Spongiivirga sp. MCCC 1A20706]|uniref:helix-turn-helix domain-containing protein n=1 Tax=Spongiivirga sp. MCCC 1A20706 TaxID=3160963 RepID=UPI003977AFBE
MLKGIVVPDNDEKTILYNKQKALENAQLGNAAEALFYAKEYIKATKDLSIINDHLFQDIKSSPEYISFKKRYAPKITFWNIIYFVAGFLGIFVGIFIHFRKKADHIGILLISLFIIFHSLFTLHLSVHLSQLQYSLPNTLFVSTTFSFLYGPLVYFYIKRAAHGYSFKWIDSIHLIPSLVLLVYIAPYYSMDSLEKFNVLFAGDAFLLPGANAIIIIKIISLVTYAYLSYRLYTNSKINKPDNTNNNTFIWQRNIILIFSIYVITYIIYAAALTRLISFAPIVHVQLILMIGLIFYVTYIAYVQPDVFSGKILLNDPKELFKYKKSGLTTSYSIELKEQLLFLLNEKKLYKRNDLSLDMLSKELGTNRHGASQVINEHFDMNFFELINSFRIHEAIELLKNDIQHNLHIIDIAYEVGFNNKVTFNKAFKKVTSCTPSQYLQSQMISVAGKV